MDPTSPRFVVVFPITTSAFGLRSDWFTTFAPKLIAPAIALIVLLLVVWVGIQALKHFEDADFSKKLWNVPALLIAVVFWPMIVVALKDIVDTFNTYLAYDILGIRWVGFGFPTGDSIPDLLAFPAQGLARLLPNLGYWILYAFYLVFFFFYAVLGPFVLAKGILTDEMENFFELVREILLILLWQTGVVILVAFIMPEIVSGQPLPPQPETNFYFLSFILGVMLFFVPTLTRKFAVHVGQAFVPLGFRWSGALLGIGMAGRLGGAALGAAGMPLQVVHRLEPWRERVSKAEEFHTRYEHRKEIQELKAEQAEIEEQLRKDFHDEHEARHWAEEAHEEEHDHFFELSKKAKEATDKHE